MDIPEIKEEKNWPKVKQALKDKDRNILELIGKYLAKAAHAAAETKLYKVRWIYFELGRESEYYSELNYVYYKALGVTIQNLEKRESFRHFANYLLFLVPIYAQESANENQEMNIGL